MAETKKSSGFSDAEKAAIKDRAKEVRKGGKGKEADAAAVQQKIADMDAADRKLAERLHTIITESAPDLAPKLWYGAPAYARSGKVVCFFRGAVQDQIRYLTLGFSEHAQLDEGSMWPTAYALTDITDADAKRIAALVKQAAGTA